MAGTQDQHLAQLVVKLLRDVDAEPEASERLRKKMLKCVLSWTGWPGLCQVTSAT